MRWRQDPADKGRLLSGLPGPTKYSFCRVQWVADTKGGQLTIAVFRLGGLLVDREAIF